MMSTRRLGILLGVLVLAAVLVVANAAAYSGSEGGYHVKLVVPQEHSDTSPEDSYNMTFIASTQTAGFLGTEGGYNLNLNLYTSGVGGAYNESGLRLYLVPKQAYISHWCDIPANDPICAELGIFACVSGYKLNETGVGLAGWTINVTNVTSGVEVGSNVTAATGFWQVCNLPAGTYTVCETPQNGWIAVDPADGCNESIELTNADITNVNFTNRECNGSISDFVWVDTNQNGVQDPGEPGIGNVTVNLYRHASPETLIGTKETDDNGYCIFDKLCPGNYSLQFILPPGYAFTQPNQGDDEQDSDVYPGTWSTAILSLGDGGIKTAIDAGLYQVGKPVPEPVPAFTPIGLIALVSLLLAIADVAIVRKRR
jgi:hypothetical protein